MHRFERLRASIVGAGVVGLLGFNPGGCIGLVALPMGWCATASEELDERARKDAVAERIARCGSCADGEQCNAVADEPTCQAGAAAWGERCRRVEPMERSVTVEAPTWEFPCAEGLRCGPGYVCTDGRRGDACTSDECGVGLVCHRGHAVDTASGQLPTCQSASKRGQPCGRDDDCVEGLRCEGAETAHAVDVPIVAGTCNVPVAPHR